MTIKPSWMGHPSGLPGDRSSLPDPYILGAPSIALLSLAMGGMYKVQPPKSIEQISMSASPFKTDYLPIRAINERVDQHPIGFDMGIAIPHPVLL